MCMHKQQGTLDLFCAIRRDSSDATVGERKWFEQALIDAGISQFRWHDLRHTFASRLVMAGVDTRTVQELMGHKTIQVTLRYAHLTPQHQLEAVQRLCDTGVALEGSTDTRTSTNGSEWSSVSAYRPTKLNTFNSLERQAGMAELADAADSKSAEGNLVGVRPPLPAPLKSIS